MLEIGKIAVISQKNSYLFVNNKIVGHIRIYVKKYLKKI